MKDTKQYNISVFEDTMRRIKETPVLSYKVEDSLRLQMYINYPVNEMPAMFEDEPDCPVMVSRERTIDCALRWLRANPTFNVTVLNFASATRPGGGVTSGSSAQEECICRCTTLYPCLNSPEANEKFYEPHRQNLGPLHNDNIIITPCVAIIKNDDNELLDMTAPHDINVITCAAPNLREKNVTAFNTEREPAPDISPDELKALHVSRARNILRAAVVTGTDVIILGAFGCGAFRNDPEVVAAAYKEVIPEFRKHFRAIQFAVYCKDSDTKNYVAFKNALE